MTNLLVLAAGNSSAALRIECGEVNVICSNEEFKKERNNDASLCADRECPRYIHLIALKGM